MKRADLEPKDRGREARCARSSPVTRRGSPDAGNVIHDLERAFDEREKNAPKRTRQLEREFPDAAPDVRRVSHRAHG